MNKSKKEFNEITRGISINTLGINYFLSIKQVIYIFYFL